jgi:hypothetical protein
MIAFVQVFH